MGTIRTYSELISIPNFADRYKYLKLHGTVGEETFGSDRWLNQKFYTSDEWRQFRDYIIVRDCGCDLACEGWAIEYKNGIFIHHLNPLTREDVIYSSDRLMDPENVVCTSFRTHNAIHYGKELVIDYLPIERKPFDTCPWR